MPQQPRRTNLATLPRRPASALAALLLLASCARPAVKAPPAAEAQPPQHAAVQPRLHAGWAFQIKPDACLAIAAAGHARLVIAVRRKLPIRLSLILPDDSHGRVLARFSGPAGAWSAPGWHAGEHEIVFSLGRDMDSLSRVLMLLSGGVMDIESPEKNLPIFMLSASGPDGQRWFTCARHLVT